MVIKCEKKTNEESLGQRKLNIRGNKETGAMRPWKEGPGWQRSQHTLSLSCPPHFFNNAQVEKPQRTQELERVREKIESLAVYLDFWIRSAERGCVEDSKAIGLQTPIVTGGRCP